MLAELTFFKFRVRGLHVRGVWLDVRLIRAGATPWQLSLRNRNSAASLATYPISCCSELGLRVSSSQLDRLFRFRADGPSPGQWWVVRSSHVAMVCWVSGQQQTPNPIRKGDEVLVAEEAQLLADGAHPLASRACSWGKTYPLIFYKYGGPLVDFIIQFQSKILREKRRERERERESSGQGKAEFRVVRFPATLIVCEATSDQDGGPRQGEERGEPRGGSEGLCWFSPRDTSLDLAIHNRTASLDTGRLCGWFESHHGLGGWDKWLDMSQKARVAKGHELPRVVSYQRSRVTKGCELPKGVSNQRVQVAKGYEHQEVRGSRGTKDRRGACSKRCLLKQVVSDPYGSVYDLLSQDMVHGTKDGSGQAKEP
ncbi:hypothetical protein F2Q68_00002409 [Brassica cretica]|uniref:Uncharacterized protein n=1 Tax=Brassica cretica TaxID=69181 RepID=A0A8S9JEY4_BRACR|nr:hypothetical protein F2Q68_00002409 [Brassica cretica]